MNAVTKNACKRILQLGTSAQHGALTHAQQKLGADDGASLGSQAGANGTG